MSHQPLYRNFRAFETGQFQQLRQSVKFKKTHNNRIEISREIES
jgi:hypothetical protein